MNKDAAHDRKMALQYFMSLLEAEKGGQFPHLTKVRSELEELCRQCLESGDVTGRPEIALWRSIMESTPKLAAEVYSVCIDNAKKFVEGEIARFREIRRERPLTAAEKKYLAEHLLPFVTRVEASLRQKKG